MERIRALVIDDEQIVLDSISMRWIENQIGPLSQNQKQWLEARLEAEIWKFN